MGNSLRCCLACVLPCGALDLIRIVHINGQVEEYSRPVSAHEILVANPNHVLSKPTSQGVAHRIMIVSPGSELKRGSIYFLIPASAIPDKKKKKKCSRKSTHDEIVRKVRIDIPTEEKRSGRHQRRQSGQVAMWKPHLESIYEDL